MASELDGRGNARWRPSEEESTKAEEFAEEDEDEDDGV